MAWLAPFEPVGYMACAASPSSATGPSTQVGTGSRSIIGFSKAQSAFAEQGRHVEPVPDPVSKWWANSSIATCRNQPLCFQPSALSIVTSAIQLIIERPVFGSGWEIG